MKLTKLKFTVPLSNDWREITLSPQSSAFTKGWVQWTRLGWGVGQASSAVHFNSSQFLYCKSWWHESPRQTMVLLGGSKGLSVTTLPTVGSGHQVGADDTWEQILDRGHRTWPPSLLFLWIPCQRAFFFSFASVWLIQTSHCASRARLVLLTFTPHLKVKG